LTFLEQRLPGIHHRQNIALLIANLDPAIVERAAMQQVFAQHLAVGVDGLAPRRFQVE